MANQVSCIILDDEPFAVQLLEEYARKVPFLEIIYAGSDVFKVIELLNSKLVDIVFIDIQMPELTGMELMNMVRNRHNFIITSAYQEYALDAFRFNVIDFLLKPVSFSRFYQSVEKYLRWKETFTEKNKSDHFFVKADRKLHKVSPSSILYIEGLKDYIRIHTNDDKIVVHENMKDIIKKLPVGEFLRIHRSYIIPVKRIRTLEGNLINIGDSLQLPVGETYRKKVTEYFRTR